MRNQTKKIYKTNFRWSGWFTIFWTLLVGIVFFYLAGTSQFDFALVWEQNAFDLATYVLIGAAASYGVPLLSWKRVTLDTFKKELRIQNQFDKIADNTRIYHLNKIKEVEKKYNFWSRSNILFITFRDGSTLKLNSNFLIKGYELDQQLLSLNGKERGDLNL